MHLMPDQALTEVINTDNKKYGSLFSCCRFFLSQFL